MLTTDLWRFCQEEVIPLEGSKTLFNMYREQDDAVDRADAPAIRRENLRSYLMCFERRPEILLVAEAPGPWGCRFSGVPITSESQLEDPDFPISGKRSSLEAPHREYSAGIFWRVMQQYFPGFMVWNALPFHPHREEEPLSIRTPRVSELKRFEPLVASLVKLVTPQVTVAIGRKAESVLGRLGVDSVYVRHPSQGGARRFEAGILEIMEP